MGIETPSRFSVIVHDFVWNRLLASYYKRYAESFNLQGDEMVLDFGCGPGALARHIAEILLKGGGQVTCLDISEAWINRAGKRLRKYPNVKFIQGDITEINIAEATFDVISIHYMLHDIGEGKRQEIISALSRTLKVGGKLFIREPTRQGHGIPADEIRKLMNKSGLKEVSSIKLKRFLLGKCYSGVFLKKQLPSTEDS